MKNALVSSLTAIVVALSMAAAATTPSMAQGDCLGKGDIQNAVGSGDIQPLPSVLANAGIEQSQEVLSVKVCDIDGQLYYVVAVLDASGEAQNLTLNAQ